MPPLLLISHLGSIPAWAYKLPGFIILDGPTTGKPTRFLLHLIFFDLCRIIFQRSNFPEKSLDGTTTHSLYSLDRTDASRHSYRSGVCTHPCATLAQSAAYPADGAVQPSARTRPPTGGSSAAPLSGHSQCLCLPNCSMKPTLAGGLSRAPLGVRR
jgi:hypothetical protein